MRNWLNSGWVPGLKCNIEVRILVIESIFFDVGLSYIAVKGFFDISDTGGNVIDGALGEHLDSTIRTITDKSCKLITVGYVVSGEAKAYSLYSAGENNMFGGLVHFSYHLSKLTSLYHVIVILDGFGCKRM